VVVVVLLYLYQSARKEAQSCQVSCGRGRREAFLEGEQLNKSTYLTHLLWLDAAVVATAKVHIEEDRSVFYELQKHALPPFISPRLSWLSIMNLRKGII